MFRRHKYVFTCPDVIYMRQRAKSRARTAIGVNVVFLAVMAACGMYLERKDKKESLTEDTDMPYPNHTA